MPHQQGLTPTLIGTDRHFNLMNSQELQIFIASAMTAVLKFVLSFLLSHNLPKATALNTLTNVVNLRGKSLPSSLHPTFLCKSTKSHFVTFSQRHSHFLRLGSMPLQTREQWKCTLRNSIDKITLVRNSSKL